MKRPPPQTLADVFLLEHGGKHFVSMSFKCRRPATTEVQDNVSCFVVQMHDVWFLVTAGHVIQEIRDGAAKGYEYHQFYLADGNGGAKLPFNSFPIAAEIDSWLVLFDDEKGMDYAVRSLAEFDVRNLRAGGIKAIGSDTWG